MNPKEPFKFLDAYAKEDADIFFGRDAEIEELYSRVFYSKLLLVYGQSGVGKTSVIRCGLANRLGEADALPIFIRHNGDMLQSLAREAGKFAMTPLPAISADTEIAAFVQSVRSLYLDYFKPIFLIFDQFEELFLFGSPAERQRFAAMLAALNEASLECRVILCIREEYLAELTAFEQTVPNLFANRLRVERMSHANALAAIAGPCRVCGVRLEDGVAEDVIARLGETAGAVELTWLQVVLDKLYHQAVHRAESGELCLTLADVAALGSLGNVLAEFLEEQIAAMGEQAASGEAVLKTLITPEGTKKTVTVADVVTLLNSMGASADAAHVAEMVNHFVTVRILREREDASGYELRHDSLAQHIFERMTALEKDMLEALQMVENRYKEYQSHGTLLDHAALEYVAPYLPRLGFKPQIVEFISKSRAAFTRARRRLLIGMFASLLAVLVVVSGLGVLSYAKYRDAERQRQTALRTQSLFLTDLARQENERGDKGNAVLLALEALPKRMNPPEKPYVSEAEVQLYDALAELPERLVLNEHLSRVSQAMFSPDGTRLLTVCLEQAQIWDISTDAETGGLLAKRSLLLRTAPNAITQAIFSPDGSRILTVLSNKTLKQWDAHSGQELPIFNGQIEGVHYAAFSPDGAKLVAVSETAAQVWNVEHGNALFALTGHSANIEQAAFSADGSRIVTASWDGSARIYDAATGAELTTLNGHRAAVLHAEFSADGTRVVTASRDNSARMWDAATGQSLATFEHSGWVEYAAFSPDGRRIVTASDDKSANVWNAANGDLLYTLLGHADRVGCAAFSPDGRRIATASWDKTARIWEPDSSLLMAQIAESTPKLAASTMTQDGKKRLVIRGEIAQIQEASTGTILAELSGHTGEIKAAVFSPDETRIATASVDKTARIWNAATGKLLTECRGHEGSVVDVSFRADGKRIVTASDDGAARMWDAATGKTLAIFAGRGRMIHAAFSDDGRRVIATSADGSAAAWRIFPTTQELIDFTNAVASRRLTDEQRRRFFLNTEGE